ncbi:MAG TPA: cytochrome D ubiquinol oxidase subunit II, partial [Candidatus Methylomirabilis sp.]|nr:cytochrome D ubiquinol oxidase subunit II [Candidatus Methylomirabilis sp.]
ARGLVSREDLCLYRVTDNFEAALEAITNFYRNYHSSRYVGDRLVIRLHRAPAGEALDRLNHDFADLLADGTMAVSPALPEEGNDHALADLPRLVLHFNRRNFGRLRQFIDVLNQLPGFPPVG